MIYMERIEEFMKLNKNAAAMAVIMAACTLAAAGCNKNDAAQESGSTAAVSAGEQTSSAEVSAAAEAADTSESFSQGWKDTASLMAQAVDLGVNINDITAENYLSEESIFFITGWYQALVNRVNGETGIPAEEALAFAQALGGSGYDEIPEYWKSSEYCEISEDRISFPQFTAELDEMLGITCSFDTAVNYDGTAQSRLIYHLDDPEFASYICNMVFEPSEGVFPCRLSTLEVTASAASGVDLSLIGGSMDNVREKNSMTELLGLYDSLQLKDIYYYDEGGTYYRTVYFRHNGENALVTFCSESAGEEYMLGRQLGDIWYYESDERMKCEIDVEGSYSEESGGYDEAVSCRLSPYNVITSVEDMGDTIVVTSAVEPDSETGMFDVFTLDKDTLHIIKEEFYYETDVLYCTTDITCNTEVNSDEYFSAWENMRTVTFIYDKFKPDGTTERITKEVRVPSVCEPVPFCSSEVYSYMDENFTITYEYPGDGVDYTVYLTNAAG